MLYQDEIYGQQEINEPVLLEIMNSAAMERLKGVLQHGISGLIGVTSPTTRFQHSVGAMLIARRLGAPLEEQVAALLHDVSHTAFSHVMDYVFDGHDDQSYHDRVKEEYVAKTDLPALLTRYGYDWRRILREEEFPILEQPSPRLCADRLDYFLRDAPPLGLATAVEIHFALDSLVLANGRIAVNNIKAARWLGYTFIKADDASWANFDEVGLYEVTALALKRALRIGAIEERAIWGTDEPLWAKLHASNDAELQSWLALVAPETRFAWDDENPTFRVSTKLRAIDPDVVGEGGELRPLSAIDPDFARYRADYLSRKQGKWPMRVIPK